MVKLEYEHNTIFQSFKIEGEFSYAMLKQLLCEIGWQIYDIEYDYTKSLVFSGDLIMPGFKNKPDGRIKLVKNCVGENFDGKFHYLCLEYEIKEEEKCLQNFSRKDVDLMCKLIINRIERCMVKEG